MGFESLASFDSGKSAAVDFRLGSWFRLRFGLKMLVIQPGGR